MWASQLAPPTNFTVAASGDFLIHGPVPGYPSFRTPPSLARAIRATGWDACSTASNHSLDAGEHGIRTTIAALRRAGIPHSGTARSARGARRAPILRVKGVRIAFLSYTAVSNGQAVPHPWSVAWASPRRILRDARRARRRGADTAIVNMHWGDEYSHAVSPSQWALARRLTRSPAIAAIVGQHAHVVQPIRRVNGKPVVSGEGNLVSNQTAACCPAASQDGLIALIRFTARNGRVRARRVRYVPTWVRHPDYRVVPAAHGSVSWRPAGSRPGSSGGPSRRGRTSPRCTRIPRASRSRSARRRGRACRRRRRPPARARRTARGRARARTGPGSSAATRRP